MIGLYARLRPRLTVTLVVTYIRVGSVFNSLVRLVVVTEYVILILFR